MRKNIVDLNLLSQWKYHIKNKKEKWITYNERRIADHKIEKELYSLLLLLKNLSIINSDRPLPSEIILSRLHSASNMLSKYIGKILSNKRKGEDDDMHYIEGVNNNTLKEFLYLISKLDLINPMELITNVEAIMEKVEESLITKSMAREDIKSLINTISTTSVMFAILLNFAVVVIFLDGMNIIMGGF